MNSWRRFYLPVGTQLPILLVSVGNKVDKRIECIAAAGSRVQK